jgi:serine/threonine-protein kinase
MSDEALGGIRSLGKYELRAVIGRGAMGTVYEAWDPVIDRRVAIKTVRFPAAHDEAMDEELQRFKREAQAAGRLTHPNIVGVYDYGETAELAYIVMEFVDGRSVKAVISGGERFSAAAIERLMDDLLAGLEYSHKSGVIHRDIKPANIMLTKDGRAKIADFGIARIESSSMTQAGTVLGTPAYMSPEQLRGEPIDLRTDIYSAAVLLYELLTGERPFDGSLSSIMHKALTTEPPAPSNLSTTSPRALDSVVARGMAKRAEDRFGTAAAFMAAIRAGFARMGLAAAPEDAADGTVISRPFVAPDANVTRPGELTQPGRRSRLPLILGGATALVVAGSVAGFLYINHPAPMPVAALPTLPLPPVPSPPSPDHPTEQAALKSQGSVASGQKDDRPTGQAALIAPRGQGAVAGSQKDESPTDHAALIAPPVSSPPVLSPPPDAGVIQQRVATSLRSLTCSALTGQMSADGVAMLRGFTAPDGLAAMRSLVTGAGAAAVDDSAVYEADPTYCEALSAISPIVPAFGAIPPHVSLHDASHSEQLVSGDYIRPRVQMPDYAATLLVDYYAHDGTVEHIYPRSGDPPIKPPADPGRVFAAGELVSLGDPGPHRAVFQVSEPFGRDMIIAIASSEPLFRSLRPHNGEQSRGYALDLRAAVEQALGRHARVSAWVIRMDTVAK